MGQCIAVSGDTIHVIWFDNKNQGSGIYYKHSFDGGITWGMDTRLSSIPSKADLPSITCSGRNVYTTFRDSSTGTIISNFLRSTNSGISWEPEFSLGDYFWWPSITSQNKNVYVALNDNQPGNSEVYFRHSNDNGVNWDPVVQISNAAGRSEDPTIAASGNVVNIAWNDKRSGSMEIYYSRSTDYGKTWCTEINLSNTAPKLTYAPMLFAVDSTVDLVWLGQTCIMHKFSFDYGATWTGYDSLAIGRSTIYPVIFRDGLNIHLVCYNQKDGIIYQHSNDGGKTWGKDSILVSSASKPMRPFVAATGNSLHIIWTDQRDGHNAIYYKRNPLGNVKSTGTNIKSFENLSFISSFSLIENPKKLSAEIIFSLFKESNLNIKIFNLYGQEVSFPVKNELLNSGTHIINFDTSNLSTGIYFCCIYSGNQLETKKFLLTMKNK
jgi:hypothetical protein